MAKIVLGEINTSGKVRSRIERGDHGIEIIDQIRAVMLPPIEMANRYKLAVQLVQGVLSPGACPQENLELILERALKKVEEIFEETKSIALSLGMYDREKEREARNTIYEMIKDVDRSQN